MQDKIAYSYQKYMESPQNSDFHSNDYGEVKTIIWDGDNTLWPWVSYAAPAYDAMCKIISQKSGKSENDVAAAMQQVYSAAGTMEYENLIQDLVSAGLFDDTENFNEHDLVEEVQKAFSSIRSKKLKLYPGIQDVMATSHKQGIENIMLTDAPEKQAQMRVKRSKLGLYLSKIHAMPSTKLKRPHPKFSQRKKEGLYEIDVESRVTTTEKPHTNLSEILQTTREYIQRHVVIISDNPAKDMALVQAHACRGILAEYGKPDPEDLKLLAKYAPPRITNKNAPTQPNTQPLQSGLIARVSHPLQILDILNISA